MTELMAGMTEWTPAGVAGLVIITAIAAGGVMMLWHLLFGDEMKSGARRDAR